MFFQPHDLEQALRLKAEHGADLTAINGGTDLVVLMNHRALRPGAFLDLSRVAGFDSAARQDNSYVLGAGATFARLGTLPVTCLARAAMSVGGPQIRNRGTIGGNLASASPAGDGSTALLALDAEVELSHARRGTRWVRLTDFFLDYRRTDLADDELITRVRFPAGGESTWYKIGKRGAVNISLVSCAAAHTAAGRFRLAFGSVAPYPVRTVKAEQMLEAQPLTDELIDSAAERAAAAVSPIDDQRGSARYRRAMCRTLAARLLRRLRDGA